MKKNLLMIMLVCTCLFMAACRQSNKEAANVPATKPASEVAEKTETNETESEEAESSNTAEAEVKGNAVTFTDALGREVTVESPKRVAALLGSFADVWCTAGGTDLLVACPEDTWKSYDLGLGDDVANIGKISKPSVETILAAEPDFVLASANTQSNIDMLETLESCGMTVAYFNVQVFDDYLNMLDILTDITGCKENYEEYGTKVGEYIEEVLKRPDGSNPSILCIRSAVNGVVAKGTKDYLLGEMLADLDCVNVADSNNTLFENLSVESIMMDDPQYIFVVVQGSEADEAKEIMEESTFNSPAWESLRAFKEGNVIYLDASLFNLKPNSRWGLAYEKLADILYPEN